ncbi:MAG: ferrochelatase, partial [Planctomycetaceae bacterium]|nr:ferrochelatase [Planctomycetaceae bacterium]
MVQTQHSQYDAILFVSFGGPDKADDVMPFLENVLRGRNVPKERMIEVAEHYHHFGGKSPINEQNIALITAIRQELSTLGPQIPVYWGNRNWHPLLTDTIREMKDAGVRRALAFVTSGFSCYSGCRQYRENIQNAREAIGQDAPEIDKIRVFFNHPGFVNPMARNVRDALDLLGNETRGPVLFTAHSIPLSMADSSDYCKQLQEASRLVAQQANISDWKLVYQSRSGPPTQPWLEPDVCDAIRNLHKRGEKSVVIAPIGFISDHMEVLFDLDTEAKELCEKLNLPMIRVETVGTHPRFVAMIRELIEERLNDDPVRLALGEMGPSHDVCPENCCPSGRPD